MSELKAVHAFDVYEAYTKTGDDDAAQVYLKSEADKVIAELQAMLEERNKQVGELKKERDWLAKDRAQAYDDLEKRAQLNIKQEESIRHQKYKRCLAMAKWCKSMMVFNDRYGTMTKWLHYNRWHKRWLELAEKFKEAK